MTEANLSDDPLHGSADVREYFGDTYPRVLAFAEMLAEQGVERGLIGPREVARLWERHILNSAALLPYLGEGRVADVGSGAGLPGLVLAAMDPQRDYVLVEPMERRTQWLFEAARECGIDNAIVVRGRAEEVAESVEVEVVTARAVAAIDKLVKWCTPLLSEGGRMVLLKGRSAPDELERAKYTLRKHRFTGEVHRAGTVPGVEATTVVVLSRA
ncbi:16S rRNA (guanine(527)-N(7))-methyltransferase RsmG [Demequina mangrovi]|uniref:Ribosomal RNA small subunit methyltransferase G n=1 Tax=Demequina mangrovi TaxID=1043493 RepID=A0A1H7A014_9MICO|nr:16S rRNA (guanine(527)-N(7))-methyltransferase RsmG [Demequina mangrovi]SEJ57774.1 16S rRNA m(7)G-527 methyltransferase [Demequina mangrovi]